MATEFNPADAVEQQPETSNQPTFKIEGYEDQRTVQEAQEASAAEADTDVGGVAEIIEDAPTNQEQEEIQQKTETSEEVVTEQEIIDVLDDVNIGNEPAIEDGAGLPEWVQKMVDFHNDTGGGLEEYRQYTKDYDALSDTEILKEYYSQTKSHYSSEDIDLLIEDKFGIEDGLYEEGEELSREDKLKKLALKDEVNNAKQHLSRYKDKYYADMKSGLHGAPEQYKDAVEHYNKFQSQSKVNQQLHDTFIKDSKKVLSEDFKGFVFEAGDKKFRLNAGDGKTLLENQSDINKVLGSFLDENGNVADVEGYHRAVWAAQNVDKIFKSAFEQGKSFALKERAKSTKNPDYTPNTGSGSAPKQQPGVKFLDHKW